MNANRASKPSEREAAAGDVSFDSGRQGETAARLLVLLGAIAYAAFVMSTTPATTLAEATAQEATLALPLLAFVLFIDANLKRNGIAMKTVGVDGAAPDAGDTRKLDGVLHRSEGAPNAQHASAGTRSARARRVAGTRRVAGAEPVTTRTCRVAGATPDAARAHRVVGATPDAARTRRVAAVAIGLLIAAACVGGIASVARFGPQPQDPPDPLVARVALAAALCLLTGVFEELLFRGIAFSAFESAFRSWRSVRNPVRAAALVQAMLFAFMHVSLQEALLLGGPIVGAQALLKMLQAFLFGMIMAGLFTRTRSLLGPIAVHAAFDCLYLGPATAISGVASASYLSGSLPDLVALAASTALIAGAAWRARGWLDAPPSSAKAAEQASGSNA